MSNKQRNTHNVLEEQYYLYTINCARTITIIYFIIYIYNFITVKTINNILFLIKNWNYEKLFNIFNSYNIFKK